MAYAFYTRPRGGEMISIEERWSRSDTVDFAFIRRSHDYGRTWTAPVARATGERRSVGMLRRQPRCGFVDHNGRYLEFWCEGVLPSDDPLEGLRQWNIYFHVSRDGGRTFDAPTQVIHAGAEYNSNHPLPGVWTGKNCVMIGEMTCVPINAPDGCILLPVEITPLAPDGQLYNPAGARSYTEALVLRGEWQGTELHWSASEPVRSGTGQSTRGMDEPTIEYLDGGRLLMVLRGSNDRRPDLPGYRWFSVSHDGGKRWTPTQPWTYDDGREVLQSQRLLATVAPPLRALILARKHYRRKPSWQPAALPLRRGRSRPRNGPAPASQYSHHRYVAAGRGSDPLPIELLCSGRSPHARDCHPYDAPVRALRGMGWRRLPLQNRRLKWLAARILQNLL